MLSSRSLVTLHRHLGLQAEGGSVGGEWVRLLHTAALVWLRHPPHSQHLRSLLERHTLADYHAAEERPEVGSRTLTGQTTICGLVLLTEVFG